MKTSLYFECERLTSLEVDVNSAKKIGVTSKIFVFAGGLVVWGVQ